MLFIMVLLARNVFLIFLNVPHEVDEGKIRLVSAVMLNGEVVETEHPTNSLAWKIPNAEGKFTYQMYQGRIDFKKC